jgi:hypothetical protein
MPEFPTKEVNIAALAYQMVNGYIGHMADFPSIVPDSVFLLIYRHVEYKATRDANHQAQAAVRLATKNKNAGLAALKDLMKSCLKKSEVDTADEPEKLTEIGWGPKAPPQPVAAPGQPLNLHPIVEGQGTCLLAWDSPIAGRAVRNYIIQRRDLGQSDFGPWNIANSALGNQINLTDQPRGVQVEYRVKAVNLAGESSSSNTVTAVL